MNPRYDDPTALTWRVRRAMFVNAGCAGSDEARMDYAAVDAAARADGRDARGREADAARLRLHLRRERPQARGPDRLLRLARVRRARGAIEPAALRVGRRSIHPYRPDAVAALEQAKADGARAVKWLPPAMGIDLGRAAHARLLRRDAAARRPAHRPPGRGAGGGGRRAPRVRQPAAHPPRARPRRARGRGALRVARPQPRPRREPQSGQGAGGARTSSSSAA